MLDLISHQLRASLIEHGKLSLKLKKEDIVSVIEDAIFHHTLKGIELGIEFRLNFEHRPIVRIDLAYMQDVFSKLIGHAMNHSEEGSYIEITVETQNQTVTIVIKYAVEDAENWDLGHDWILERNFSQSIKARVPMIKQLVKGHGGKLWISRMDIGKCTCYSMELPIAGIDQSL